MRRRRSTKGPRQLLLPFLARRERIERWSRRSILALTAAAIAAILLSPKGRELMARPTAVLSKVYAGALGPATSRKAIEADWAERRRKGIEATRSTYNQAYAETSDKLKRLLVYSGLTPEDAVLRWGNFDKILLLPGTVFAPDDAGRSYRLRPNVSSIWLRNVALPRNLNGFFLVPDGSELRSIVEGTGVIIVEGSEQTTNSWGCRGPEPDPDAPIRGIVLGDSNMQGLLIGDDDTPPERLARDLEGRLNRRVSMLNTGHLGYSPEQYCRTLEEYGERFKPDFVLLTFCVNDFGDVSEAVSGGGDWDESRYWIDRIYQYCRTREYLCLTVPMPYDHQITASRHEGGYPGKLNDVTGVSSLRYIFPIEDLVDEYVRIRLEATRTGAPISANPLYNVHLGDHHFSPRGSDVWARAVGRRLSPLLELHLAERRKTR